MPQTTRFLPFLFAAKNVFIDCVSQLEAPPNNLAKAQAFLAAMHK